MKKRIRKALGGFLGLSAIGSAGLVGCAVDTDSDVGYQEDVRDKIQPLCRTGSEWPNGTVNVCFTPTAVGHTNFANRSLEIRADVESSWERFGNVQFVGWGQCTSSQMSSSSTNTVRINFVDGARANAGGIGHKSKSYTMTLDPTEGSSRRRQINVHEFGHVLGYRHEFVRTDNPGTTCPLQNDESSTSCDTEGTSFDPQSIMVSTNYCNTNRALSSSDVLGVRQTYGNKSGYVAGVISQDYDGDGLADQVLYRAPNWFIRPRGGGSDIVINFGASTDRPVPGDYDGDGKTDAAVFRPSNGKWYVKRSGGGSDLVMTFGVASDIQVMGDYDGDGKTDAAVFRPSNGKWYAKKSGGGSDMVVTFGIASDIPVPGDYDGDGKTDPAVFRPSNGTWYARLSGGGSDMVMPFGLASDVPVAADFDGDGETDVAVFRPSNNTWYARRSGGGADIVISLGDRRDSLLPADYDGDGKADAATYRGVDNDWRIKPSSGGSTIVNEFGIITDVYPNSR